MITVSQLNYGSRKFKENKEKELSREEKLNRAETMIDLLLKVSANNGRTYRDLSDRALVLDYLGNMDGAIEVLSRYTNDYHIKLTAGEDGQTIEHLSLDWTDGVAPGLDMSVV